MTICICDDEPEYAKKVSCLASEYFGNNFKSIDILTPSELEGLISKSLFPYDILITDIDMDNLNGIQLVDKVNHINARCNVIYLSAYLDYAPLVYETNHCYFVHKPYVETTLPLALKKACLGYLNNQASIEIVSGRQKVCVLANDIMYIERIQRICHIVTKTNNYETYESLQSLNDALPEFIVRCHSGYLVNIHYLSDINSSSIHLADAYHTCVPIGRRYAKDVKTAYLDYYSTLI